MLPCDGTRQPKNAGKTAMENHALLKKFRQNHDILLKKIPLFVIMRKDGDRCLFIRKFYIPFFREEKNYG